MDRRFLRCRNVSPSSPAAVFNVVIVYEDITTGIRAQEATRSIGLELRTDEDMAINFWNLDLLQTGALGIVAAQQASAADLVILSLHESGNLPQALKNWIATWRFNDTAHHPTMIALFDKLFGEQLDCMPPRRVDVEEEGSAVLLNANLQRADDELATAGCDLVWLM